MKIKCEECNKTFISEIKLEIIHGIHGRYVECSHCKDRYPIDFYDIDLQSLVNQVNLRTMILTFLNKDVEQDLEIINLTKRINNLSNYLMSEALRRSKGKPCYVKANLNYENTI